MKQWHLYLDESGSFDATKENGRSDYNIVAGFLLPGDKNDATIAKRHRNIVAQWVSEAEEAAKERFANDDAYDFGHCSSNAGKWSLRKRIQPFLLQAYCERIVKAGGRIVIFDGGLATVDVSNTKTFLSILSKGIIRLYHDLEKEDSDNKVELFAHCASRFIDGDPSKPLIPERNYQEEMKHVAFLLCEFTDLPSGKNPFFHTVDTLEVMPSTNNPLTVVCDYISNTYQHTQLCGMEGSEWKEAYDAAYSKKHCLCYDTTQSARIEKGELNQMEQDRSYVPMLIRIINRRNPTQELIEAFFDRLNATPPFVRRMFAAELIEHIGVETNGYYLGIYGDIVWRIERIISLIKAHLDDRELKTQILANTYLYLLTMHTHTGEDRAVLEDARLVRETVSDLHDDAAAARLWEIYYNRLLVFQTDRFEFEKVSDGFSKLSKYWEKMFEAYRVFDALPQSERRTVSVEYGKEIGSYLQMLRFLLRLSKLNESEYFEAWCDQAHEYWQKGCSHLTGGDLSRLHQTMCDIETEIGDYDRAFWHLYEAANLMLEKEKRREYEEPFGKTEIGVILATAGEAGMRNPFLYYHYVRLASEMILARDIERGKTLLKRVPESLSPASFKDIRAHDMRIDIKWKLGAVYARTGSAHRAKQFLDDALADALGRQERAFDAIALAIACERAALGQGSAKDVPEIYREFLRKTDAVKAENPFAQVLTDADMALDAATLMKASRVIAY